MNPRTLRIFAVIAVLGLALAWWASDRGPSASTVADAGDPFLPGLSARINEVVRVEIDDGATPLRYERRGAAWVDLERGGYPAKAEELTRLLRGLLALEKREAKTARPERHAELQLADEGEADERAKRLRLWVTGQETPAWEVLIGQSKYSPVRGLYARMAGDPQCWYLSGEVALPYQPTAWLDKEIANANQSEVQSITLRRGEQSFHVTRPDEATPWTLSELPEGRALKEFSPFGALANALGFLSFEEVAPATEERFTRSPDLIAEYGFFHGATIRLEGWTLGEADAPEVWVRLASTPPTALAEGVDSDPGQGPSAETLAQWEAKWQGWVYKLPQWKGGALQQDLDDWLEPLVEDVPVEDAPIEDTPPSEDGD